MVIGEVIVVTLQVSRSMLVSSSLHNLTSFWTSV